MRKGILFLGTFIVPLLIFIIAGCIEENTVDVNGVVVDKAPPTEYPEYEEQEYWILVENINGTRYNITGEGIWMGYNITDKFHQQVPVELITEPKEPVEEPDLSMVYVLSTVLIILLITVAVLMKFRD